MKLKPVFEKIVIDNKVIIAVELKPSEVPKERKEHDKKTGHASSRHLLPF